MARERWFYAEGHRRMGPVARRQLVEALLQLTDPRTCLVWRRGLQSWTPAADVPEIDRMLTPQTPAPVPVAPAAPTSRPVTGRTARPARPSAPPPAGGRAPLYAGGVAAVLVVGALAWWLWPRPAVAPVEPGTGDPASSNGGTSASTPVPGSTAVAPPVEGGPGGGRTFTGWADQEAELPPAELRQLRGVGGWAGDKLRVTLYNGSTWRVTEIYVLTSKMEGDHFVDAVALQVLLPVGGAPVDGAVQDLLQKVAPDRKRAGVNPADTGPFEVVLGPQPSAYRWKIERARGYPPRQP